MVAGALYSFVCRVHGVFASAAISINGVPRAQHCPQCNALAEVWVGPPPSVRGA